MIDFATGLVVWLAAGILFFAIARVVVVRAIYKYASRGDNGSAIWSDRPAPDVAFRRAKHTPKN
jgi:hypothetical protein